MMDSSCRRRAPLLHSVCCPDEGLSAVQYFRDPLLAECNTMHTWALLMSASSLSQLLIASSEHTHADIGRVKILYASATSTARCDLHSYKLHSRCECWACDIKLYLPDAFTAFLKPF